MSKLLEKTNHEISIIKSISKKIKMLAVDFYCIGNVDLARKLHGYTDSLLLSCEKIKDEINKVKQK